MSAFSPATKKPARGLPAASAPKYADLARHASEDSSHPEGAEDIAALLATLDDAALTEHVIDLLKLELAEILRLPAAKLDPARPLSDMGLDSLMGVELAMALETRFGVRLSVMALGEAATVATLAQRLVGLLRGSAGQGSAPESAQHDTVADIAARHAAEVSPAEVAEFAATFSAAAHSDSAAPRLIG